VKALETNYTKLNNHLSCPSCFECKFWQGHQSVTQQHPLFLFLVQIQNTLCGHFAQYCCTRSQYIKLADSHKLNWGWIASDIRQWNHVSLSCGAFLHWVYDSGKFQFLSLLLHCITLVVLLLGGANFWDFSPYVLINGWQLNSSINLPLQSLSNGGGSTISCYEDTGRYIHTYIHTYLYIYT
jgi:hypothetical protein